MSTPKRNFLESVNQKNFNYDKNQLYVIEQLQSLFVSLMDQFCKWRWNNTIQGVYIWGGVGRGKTLIMDIFSHCLPSKKVLRMHFYQWMQLIHKMLEENKGKKNPLNIVVNNLVKSYKVICLDEFLVLDIADAMILSKLLEGFFLKEVVFVTTSNLHPDDLYKNGLQREKFLPAIELIKKQCHVLSIGEGTDYRCYDGLRETLFFYPLHKKNHQALSLKFFEFTGKQPTDYRSVSKSVKKGRIDILIAYGEVVWIAFEELCIQAKSSLDYLELLSFARVIILEGVLDLTLAGDATTRRFIWLVDMCYDKKAILIISSEKSMNTMYLGYKLREEFKRTYSRLVEMQSLKYLKNIPGYVYKRI